MDNDVRGLSLGIGSGMEFVRSGPTACCLYCPSSETVQRPHAQVLVERPQEVPHLQARLQPEADPEQPPVEGARLRGESELRNICCYFLERHYVSFFGFIVFWHSKGVMWQHELQAQ